MKTTNNAQKTVKGQLNAMVLRGSAVVFSFVLISLTVSAQEFWKQFLTSSPSGQITSQVVTEPSEFEKADAAIRAIHAEFKAHNSGLSEAIVVETEADEELKVESWMTNEILFGADAAAIIKEEDEPLDLESWMVNGLNFSRQSIVVADEVESTLKMEAWMTEEANFNAAEILTERDADLKIENWMIDSRIFTNHSELKNGHLNFESWMADASIWGL